MSQGVPQLSLAAYTHGTKAARAAFCADLLRGLQEYGFIVLADHGVAPRLLDAAYAQVQALFALEESRKLRWRGGLRGYTPFGTEHARDHAVPDLKEFWQVGREVPPGVDLGEPFPPNVWPEGLPGFRETFTRLFEALDATGRLLLEALEPGLQLPTGYFDPLVRRGNSVLRLIHYPPVSDDAAPGAVRSAAHEDINFLTILVAARGAGLELLDRDGSWLPVVAEPRHLIVDSGDMLARLTNDVIPATTHRVVNPTGPNVSRYSMPFFLHPSSATSLRCLPACVGTGAKYPPITAGQFLEERLREIGLA
ncbi:MAG: 2-oxoglutarate and iron-dependent oxygenase domain-containing protein [Steroidobacteraceae bacterium]